MTTAPYREVLEQQYPDAQNVTVISHENRRAAVVVANPRSGSKRLIILNGFEVVQTQRFRSVEEALKTAREKVLQWR